MALTYWQIVARLAAATVVGILFGIERKKNNKPVGARTHVLICVAACIISMLSAYGFQDVCLNGYAGGAEVRSDPARLMVGVLTGIGFLGAGIIWKSPNGPIHGITTAAAVYLAAVLGIVAGLGEYFLLAVGTAISMAALVADDIANDIRHKREEHKLVEHEKQDTQQGEISA